MMKFKNATVTFEQDDAVKGKIQQENVIAVEDVPEGKEWSAKAVRTLYFLAIMRKIKAGKNPETGKREYKALNINLGKKFTVSIQLDEEGAPKFKANDVSVDRLNKHLNRMIQEAIMSQSDMKD